jgi:hypothetical protein
MLLLLAFIFFSSTKSENKRVEQVLPGRGWGKGEEVAQIIYTHVSKCKNDKRKISSRIYIQNTK